MDGHVVGLESEVAACGFRRDCVVEEFLAHLVCAETRAKSGAGGGGMVLPIFGQLADAYLKGCLVPSKLRDDGHNLVPTLVLRPGFI